MALFKFHYTDGAGLTVHPVAARPRLPRIVDGQFLIEGDEVDIPSDIYITEALFGDFEGFVLSPDIRSAFDRVKRFFGEAECPPYVARCSQCPFAEGCVVEEY